MTRYLAAALAAVLVVAGTIAKVQTDRARDLDHRLAVSEAARATDRRTFEAASESQKRAIAGLEQARARDQQRLDALARENARITEERDHEKRKFDAWRNRIAKAARTRPGLVGRAATRAVGRLFDAFRTASAVDGGAPDGGARPLPPAAAPTDRGAR
jgi:hypothetical protein